MENPTPTCVKPFEVMYVQLVEEVIKFSIYNIGVILMYSEECRQNALCRRKHLIHFVSEWTEIFLCYHREGPLLFKPRITVWSSHGKMKALCLKFNIFWCIPYLQGWRSRYGRWAGGAGMAGGLEEPVWPVGWRSRYGRWAGGAGMAGTA